jgi:hypothetical protein
VTFTCVIISTPRSASLRCAYAPSLSQLRQDDLLRRDQHSADEFGLQVWVEIYRIVDEIIDSAHRFDSCESCSRDDKCEQGLTLIRSAFRARLLQMPDQPTPQFDRVVESSDGQGATLNAWQPIEVRAGTEREYQMVIQKCVDMTVEPMGDRDEFALQVDRVDLAGEGLYSSKQLAQRTDYSAYLQVTRRDLMEHRGKEKIVIARDQRYLDIAAAGQKPFELQGCVRPAKTTPRE